jgi:hypothetical protein
MTRETAPSIEYIEREEDIERIEQIERGRPVPRFTPPTREEVFNFAMDEQIPLNVDKFYNHFTSTGWRSGNSPIVDWKARARAWVEEDRQKAAASAARYPAKRVPAQEYQQRDYDDEDEAARRRMIAMARGDYVD